jgi:prephenate dehydrogenase
MWRDIALANRKNLLRALRVFANDLNGFRRALEKVDSDEISMFFQRAKRQRDQWSKRAGSPSPE